MRRFLISFLLWVVSFSITLWLGSSDAIAGKPALLFSDLDWGPRTGWEGSDTRGAAITIWGKHFGTSRGASYVSVGGISLTKDSDYAEWGVPGPARGLQRICFWLNSSIPTGERSISVTVNGITAEADLRIDVRAGGIIRFIATEGNDGNNGRLAAAQGGANGPWKTIKKFDPENNDSSHLHEYIVYLRSGTYTDLDESGSFLLFRAPASGSGGPAARKAIIGYPGEAFPILDMSSSNPKASGHAFRTYPNYVSYGPLKYYTFAKLQGRGEFVSSYSGGQGNCPNYGLGFANCWGEFIRYVGIEMVDLCRSGQVGCIFLNNTSHSKIYGCLFNGGGNDSYKHDIYCKTHGGSGQPPAPYDCFDNDIGWNEFANFRHLRSTDGTPRGGQIFISTHGPAANQGRYTRNIYIHDNYFHDGATEFIYTGDNTLVHHISIFNNIMRNSTCPLRGVHLAWYTQDCELFNNFFSHIGSETSHGMLEIQGRSSSQLTTAVLRNNVYVAHNGQRFFSARGSYRRVDVQNELFFNPDGSSRISSPSGFSITHCQTGDPLLITPTNEDFTVGASSPCIDAGSRDVSSVVTRDCEGVPRPQHDNFDIGAPEFVVRPPQSFRFSARH